MNFSLNDVKVKGTVPEGTFTGSAEDIVKKLLKSTNGNLVKAKLRITFYINRAGDSLSNAKEVKRAKDILMNK